MAHCLIASHCCITAKATAREQQIFKYIFFLSTEEHHKIIRRWYTSEGYTNEQATGLFGGV